MSPALIAIAAALLTLLCAAVAFAAARAAMAGEARQAAERRLLATEAELASLRGEHDRVVVAWRALDQSLIRCVGPGWWGGDPAHDEARGAMNRALGLPGTPVPRPASGQVWADPETGSYWEVCGLAPEDDEDGDAWAVREIGGPRFDHWLADDFLCARFMFSAGGAPVLECPVSQMRVRTRRMAS